MKTCGTCSLWGESGEKGKYRTCCAVPHDERGYCEEDCWDEDMIGAESKEKWLEMRESPAVVKDGSGYYAALKTRKDFACSLHEEKTSEAPAP